MCRVRKKQNHGRRLVFLGLDSSNEMQPKEFHNIIWSVLMGLAALKPNRGWIALCTTEMVNLPIGART